jgi:hypothetical protein
MREAAIMPSLIVVFGAALALLFFRSETDTVVGVEIAPLGTSPLNLYLFSPG